MSDCTVGAVIGDGYSKLLNKCRLCGRSGESAFEHAIRELLRGGPPHAGGGGDEGLGVPTRVHAVRCGFQVMEAAEESRFEGCTVTEGHQAMAMSAWEDAPAGMHGAPVSVPPMRLLPEVTVDADSG
eukprot:jgi/Ulvmu1/1017/UM104_0002.1